MNNHTRFRKSLYYVFIFFVVYSMRSQDSVSISNLNTRDHASNRLFWMSTGRISTPKKFFIGNFEVIATQAGYTPNDFLQFNATYVTLFDNESYWSVGAKVQILKSDESIVQGLAVGTDFGFFPGVGKRSNDLFMSPLKTFNIAASFGSRDEQIHFNLLGINNQSGLQTLLQIGGSIELNRPNSRRGLKLMGEILIVPSSTSTLELTSGIIGIRSYGKVFVGELALIIFPSLNLSHSSSSGNGPVPFPYFSVMWYF